MAAVVNGSVGFVRKKLRDGTVVPLDEQERYAWERAFKLQERINARHNLEWMRESSLKSWTDEDFETLKMALGLDDINVEETAPSTRLSLGKPGSIEEGTWESAEANA